MRAPWTPNFLSTEFFVCGVAYVHSSMCPRMGPKRPQASVSAFPVWLQQPSERLCHHICGAKGDPSFEINVEVFLDLLQQRTITYTLQLLLN